MTQSYKTTCMASRRSRRLVCTEEHSPRTVLVTCPASPSPSPQEQTNRQRHNAMHSSPNIIPRNRPSLVHMNSREDLNKPSPVVRRRSVVLTAEYKCSHKQRLSVENIHIMSSLPQIIKGALTSPEAGRHEGEGGTGELEERVSGHCKLYSSSETLLREH